MSAKQQRKTWEPKMNKKLACLAAFVSIVFLGACSGTSAASTPPAEVAATQPPADTSNSAQPGGIDACTVLTRADAESILGGSVKDPEHPVDGAATFIVTSCTYHLQDTASNDRVSLIISVAANGSAQTAQVAFTEDQNTSSELWGATGVDIPGLGDAAMWVGGSGNYISLVRGYIYITLRSTNYQGNTPAQPLIDLAQVIVSRLP